MDNGTENHRFTSGEAEKGKRNPIDPAQRLTLAKERFLRASQALSPLGVVRQRPLTSIGCAFLLGFGFMGLRGKAALASLAPLALRAGDLLIRHALDLRK